MSALLVLVLSDTFWPVGSPQPVLTPQEQWGPGWQWQLQQQHPALVPCWLWGHLSGLGSTQWTQPVCLSPGHCCHCCHCWGSHWSAWPGAVPARFWTKLSSTGAGAMLREQPRDTRCHPDGCCHLEFSQIKIQWSQSCCYIPVSLLYNLSFESAADSFICVFGEQRRAVDSIYTFSWVQRVALAEEEFGGRRSKPEKSWNCSFLLFKNKSF